MRILGFESLATSHLRKLITIETKLPLVYTRERANYDKRERERGEDVIFLLM